MRQEFEYQTGRITASKNEELTNLLDDFGKDGWELVSLIPLGVYPSITFLAVFKRTVFDVDC